MVLLSHYSGVYWMLDARGKSVQSQGFVVDAGHVTIDLNTLAEFVRFLFSTPAWTSFGRVLLAEEAPVALGLHPSSLHSYIPAISRRTQWQWYRHRRQVIISVSVA